MQAEKVGEEVMGHEMGLGPDCHGQCLNMKPQGFPVERLSVECRASERSLTVQLGVNVTWTVLASRWPASCCVLLQSSHLLQL